MIELRNPDTDEVYRIRSVPLAEAHELRRNGVIMYDYTKLTAMNTCPTWGTLRYGLHKTEIPLDQGGRNLAIECGSACHDFFAALRWWHLMHEQPEGWSVDSIYEQMIKHFGKERVDSMFAVAQDSDRVNNAQLFALDALHSTGYYDDPNDRRRTMSNMESSCLVYADNYFKRDMPVFVKGDLIGIEIPFVLEVTAEDAYLEDMPPQRAYYCGRIDGVHKYGGDIIVAENKTASRLSDVWRMAFAINNQVTGYTIAASVLFGEDVSSAAVMGVQIPLPKSFHDGVAFEFVTRSESDRIRWCEWFFHSVAAYEAYVPRPTLAPRYPHSCNRFFSACQFIPYCALPREEQAQAIADMRMDEWSPLDHIDEKGEAE